MIEGVSSFGPLFSHISAQNSTPFAACTTFFDGLCPVCCGRVKKMHCLVWVVRRGKLFLLREATKLRLPLAPVVRQNKGRVTVRRKRLGKLPLLIIFLIS